MLRGVKTERKPLILKDIRERERERGREREREGEREGARGEKNSQVAKNPTRIEMQMILKCA